MAQATITQLAHSLGRNARTLKNQRFDLFPPPVVDGNLVVAPTLPVATAAATTSGTAYFMYLGKTSRQITSQKVLVAMSTAGAGTQVAEIGLFSSPGSPNRAGQTLTRLASTATVDDLTSANTVRGNTTAFAVDIAAGVHLWAGIRTAMVTTQPTLYGVTGDLSCGRVLSTASAAAFAAGTTYVGALVTHALTWQAPYFVFHCS